MCKCVIDSSIASLKFLYDLNLILDSPHFVLQIFQLNQYSERLVSTYVYKGHLIQCRDCESLYIPWQTIFSGWKFSFQVFYTRYASTLLTCHMHFHLGTTKLFFEVTLLKISHFSLIVLQQPRKLWESAVPNSNKWYVIKFLNTSWWSGMALHLLFFCILTYVEVFWASCVLPSAPTAVYKNFLL